MASRLIVSVACVLSIAACSEKGAPKMSEEWCDAMLDKPNVEWAEEDFEVFGANCLFNEKQPE